MMSLSYPYLHPPGRTCRTAQPTYSPAPPSWYPSAVRQAARRREGNLFSLVIERRRIGYRVALCPGGGWEGKGSLDLGQRAPERGIVAAIDSEVLETLIKCPFFGHLNFPSSGFWPGIPPRERDCDDPPHLPLPIHDPAGDLKGRRIRATPEPGGSSSSVPAGLSRSLCHN